MSRKEKLHEFLITVKYSENLSKMSDSQLVDEIFEHIYGDLRMGQKECIISEVIKRLRGVE